MSMGWRLASRLSVITLAVLVVVIVALFGLRESTGLPVTSDSNTNNVGLQGTDLGGIPAPDFRLTDQFSKQVSLSQFKGKPVVLTFLYTHCPDVCPLIAEKLHATMLDLGSDAQRVGVLAVSMDPKGDTIPAAVNFSKVHRMLDYWHFLVGTHDDLAPVWSSYSVDAQAATSQGRVTHTSAIYVIDKQGRERVLLDNDFTSAQLATDVKILLKE